jgi:GxxExxY protein
MGLPQMNTRQPLLYGDLTQKVIGAAFDVHNSLGKGLNEKVYENALSVRLRDLGLSVEQQKVLPVYFDNHKVGEQIVDLVVDERVIVETKAVDRLLKNHEAQLLGYLKNTQFQLGLLINFGTRVQFKRLIFTVQNK